MRYWLVMPAAGSGRRFGAASPKQYAKLAGRTVIEWALAPFLGDRRCAGIIVALAAEDGEWARIAARLHAVQQTASAGTPSPTVTAVAGGTQRSLSVRAVLAALAERA